MARATPAADARGLAASWLLAVQRPDGAWGYRPGGEPFVEPTALALLALLDQQPLAAGARAAVRSAADALCARQRPDGAWGVAPSDDGPSWMTAYAAWALVRAADSLGDARLRTAADAALGWLLAPARPVVEGEALDEVRQLLGIDGSLVGWPWVPGDAHWVFPTAITLLAAGAAGRADEPRVAQGAALLLDRACPAGGWNWGNPYMLRQPYAPTVVDTAAGLLALGAVGRAAAPAVPAGLSALRALAAGASGALSLAWAVLALRAYGDPTAELAGRLLALQSPDGSWSGQPFTTALAVLALGDQPVVRIPRRQ